MILDELNEKQKEAVMATEGPVLIIAGAGSGKTKALTHRIAHIITDKQVPSWHILAVTFTNKASAEMKNRIATLLKNELEELPTVGTFHSICAQILRKHIHLMGYENSFVIYDANDQTVLMKALMKDRCISEKELNPKAVLAHISAAKNQLINTEQYELQSHNYFTQKVAELYGPYQQRLAKNQALDFNDLIMKTVELFQNFPDILQKYQDRYRYISVDEYQDTNHAQYVLINMLAEKYGNICVIGDPDQSIYSWRGANMQNILDFENDYPNALVIKLEQNYRSTSVILDAAHAVIAKNSKRKEKQLWTERKGGEPIRLWTAISERDEAHKVAQAIIQKVQGSELPAYHDFAVLYRTNAQSRALEEGFMRYGVPYKIVGGVKFYQRKEVKDIIAYLRVILNPDDSVSLLRIINTPSRKIGAKTLEALQTFAAGRNISVYRALQRASEIGAITQSKAMALEKFLALIEYFQNINQEFTASGVIKHVISESGYAAALTADKTPEAQARLQNINELITVADKYEALEPGISLATFLEEVALISDLDSLEAGQNAVTLMTLHSAKGLEFSTVFICGLEEGVFPHSRALYEPMELEEERRLMYVGITRAKDRLFLLHARERMLFGEFKQSAPSQFLLDLPENVLEGSQMPHREHRHFGNRAIPIEDEVGLMEIELYDGDRVRHRNFGEGVVLNVQGGIATIAFKNPQFGIKKLATGIAPLEKL